MNLRRNAVAAIAVTTAAVGVIFVAIMLPPSMAIPVVDESTLESTVEPSEQQPPQEQPWTEKPSVPVLIKVAISPEARVKATAIAGQHDLRQGEWSEFTITIDNAAGITAPLVVESEQIMTSDSDTARDRWLRLTLEPSGPLSGATTETRLLRLRSRDPGIRTAVLNINAGQGTQDLGFRSDVVISFHILLAGHTTQVIFRADEPTAPAQTTFVGPTLFDRIELLSSIGASARTPKCFCKPELWEAHPTATLAVNRSAKRN